MSMYGKNHYNIKEKKIKEYFKSKKKRKERKKMWELPGGPREGKGNSLQYSCLENLMDRAA